MHAKITHATSHNMIKFIDMLREKKVKKYMKRNEVHSILRSKSFASKNKFLPLQKNIIIFIIYIRCSDRKSRSLTSIGTEKLIEKKFIA